VDKCPDQLKLPFALWKRNAVREFIRQRFNVKMSLQTVSDYLKLWGFTPKKAIRRAYEHNEKRVREWVKYKAAMEVSEEACSQ